MNYKNKFLITLILLSFSSFLVFADTNKDNILTKISSLKTEITDIKNTKIIDLETKMTILSQKYNEVYTNLGYNANDINNLVSLGVLKTNHKEDLIKEFTQLKSELSTKITSQNDSLNTIEDNVKYSYSIITDNQKNTFLTSITKVEDEIKNLKSTFETKAEAFNSKYNANLENYKTIIKSAFETNKNVLSNLKTFSDKYDNLYSINEEFQKNYEKFKKEYLSYAGDLTIFSKERQLYYIDALKKELEKIRDGNIEANKSLATYKVDIDRLIDILLENFTNSLNLKIDEIYGVIYSDSDINSINSKFTTIKNRYYDSDGKLKANEFISSSGAIEEINFIGEKLGEINKKIILLVGTGSDSNSLENIKIRLENEMVKFYNSNYKPYREDLILKLKEKLNIVSLETKNILLVADSVDLRFSLLKDKITSSTDLKYINEQIEIFKKDISKYNYLNNDIINTKITNLQNNLNTFVVSKELSLMKNELSLVKKELNLFKYSKFSQKDYNLRLEELFIKLKLKHPEKYKDKLKKVLIKVNLLLENSKLSNKNRFIILVVKLNILTQLDPNFLIK